MTSGWTWWDGDERMDFTIEGDEIVRRHSSARESEILAQNAAIRSAGGTRPGEWCQPILSMSYAIYLKLLKDYPILEYGSNAEQTVKWIEIANDPAFRKLQLEDH